MTTEEPMVSVVLPTLDERDSIQPLVADIHRALQDLPHEIIVVDDGSTDGTREVVEHLMEQQPHVRLIRRDGEPCLATAIYTGLMAGSGRIKAWMDADGSHPPDVLRKLVDVVDRGEADLAMASRYVPGGAPKGFEPGAGITGLARGLWNLAHSQDSVLATSVSFMGNHLLSRWMGLHVTDLTSGFMAAAAPVLRRLPWGGHHGEYFIQLLAVAQHLGLKVVEVPFTNLARTHGRSKTADGLAGTVRRSTSYLIHAAGLRWRLKHEGRKRP